MGTIFQVSLPVKPSILANMWPAWSVESPSSLANVCTFLLVPAPFLRSFKVNVAHSQVVYLVPRWLFCTYLTRPPAALFLTPRRCTPITQFFVLANGCRSGAWGWDLTNRSPSAIADRIELNDCLTRLALSWGSVAFFEPFVPPAYTVCVDSTISNTDKHKLWYIFIAHTGLVITSIDCWSIVDGDLGCSLHVI